MGCCRDSSADRRPATLVGGSSSASGSDGSRSGSPASTASREWRWHVVTGAPGNGHSIAARGATSGRVSDYSLQFAFVKCGACRQCLSGRLKGRFYYTCEV